jgi:NADH:ubiquinone oxidoreductase subunit 4 (subunit M)
VVYATRLLKEIVFGEPQARPITVDLGARELALVVVLGTCTIWFGLLPQLLMAPLTPAVEAVIAAIDAVR